MYITNKNKGDEYMTQSKNKKEAERLFTQMDLQLQEYALDILRHLKMAQDILKKNNNSESSKPA